MSLATRSVAFAGLALAGAAVGVWVALVPAADARLPGAPAAARSDRPTVAAPRADSVAAGLVARDPFRIARRPASMAYDLAHAALPPGPVPPKPALVLTGIVWDPQGNASAVLDGLPGAGGPRVVRPGDSIGALRVRRIERERVVVAGLDTIWTLTVREPWH